MKCTESQGTETDRDESEERQVEAKVAWMDQEKSEASTGPKKALESGSDREDQAKWARSQAGCNGIKGTHQRGLPLMMRAWK